MPSCRPSAKLTRFVLLILLWFIKDCGWRSRIVYKEVPSGRGLLHASRKSQSDAEATPTVSERGSPSADLLTGRRNLIHISLLHLMTLYHSSHKYSIFYKKCSIGKRSSTFSWPAQLPLTRDSPSLTNSLRMNQYPSSFYQRRPVEWASTWQLLALSSCAYNWVLFYFHLSLTALFL